LELSTLTFRISEATWGVGSYSASFERSHRCVKAQIGAKSVVASYPEPRPGASRRFASYRGHRQISIGHCNLSKKVIRKLITVCPPTVLGLLWPFD